MQRFFHRLPRNKTMLKHNKQQKTKLGRLKIREKERIQ